MNLKYNNCTKEWIVVTPLGAHVPFENIEDAEQFLDNAEQATKTEQQWNLQVSDIDGQIHRFDSPEDRRQWLHWYKNELKMIWKINADPPERTDTVESSTTSRWVCFNYDAVMNGQCAPYYPPKPGWGE